MFSQASVILSKGGVCVAEGLCMAGGMHGRGHMHGRGSVHHRGHAWWGACITGSMCCRGHAWHGGMHVRGYAWQEHAGQLGMHGRGACMAGETATAADGMHPTGMHSCLVMNLPLVMRLFEDPFWY